jgi:hypothetical protein
MLRIIADSQQKKASVQRERERKRLWRNEEKETNKERKWTYELLSNKVVCMKFWIMICIANIDYNSTFEAQP